MADAATAPNPKQQVPLDTIPISPSDQSELSEQSTQATSEGEVRTVFHDPQNFNVKHPLMNTWTLWFTKPPSGGNEKWDQLLKEVISFDSVEEFWGIYANIHLTSTLPNKADYHIFKKGVKPAWEDPQNEHGGKWAFQFKDKKATNIDKLWLAAVMAAIGETLETEDDNEVMGVVVNVRKGFYRIGVWTRTVGRALPGDKSNTRPTNDGRDGITILKEIGLNFKNALLKEDKNIKNVEFSRHSDSDNSGSTRAKPMFIV